MHVSGMTTNGRSASESGTAGYQDISGADLVRMLTQDQAKADHSGPVGSHGITSSSVMGILVGEGLKKAVEGGSSENFGMLMKSFQQLVGRENVQV